MVNKVICPKCGSFKIIEDDSYDTYSFGTPVSKGIKIRIVGTCMDCSTKIQWNEVYNFVGYDEIEED